MRLLSLNPNGSEESALDFHPMVTVVNGLGLLGRQQVLHAISALPGGRDPGVGGLIEAHGVMLDLNPTNLALLDLANDLDVLVRPSDLPLTPEHAEAGKAVAEPTPRLTVEQFLAVTPEGRFPELDVARRRRDDSAEALELLRDALAKTTRGLEEARVRRERAELAIERAMAALRGDEAGDGVGTFDPASPSFDPGEMALRQAELDVELEQLREALARIDRGLDELSGIDTRPIQVLLDAIRDPGPVEYVVSERANELADEFRRLQADVQVLEQRLEDRGFGPATAMHQLEQARAALAEAERGVAKPDLSPDDITELEAAHEAVLEAERKASGFGRRNQKRLDEVRAAEQVILDRVGFPTWSAYVMGSTLLSIDPVAEQRLEKARFEVESAEAHWADITAMIEADPEHRSLIDQLEAVYLEAYDLLDGDEPEDVEAALRQVKVPRREVTTEELVDALVYQLELVGLNLPADMVGVDYAVVVADAFLAEAAGINDRIAELRDERRRTESALESIEREQQTLAAADARVTTIDLTEPHAADDSDVDLVALEGELAAARENEADHRDAVEAREALVDAATQIDAVSTSRLIKLATDLAEKVGQPLDDKPRSEPAFEIDPGGDDAQSVPEAIEFYLLARLAALRSVSFAGSVPLVLDDTFADIDPELVRSLLGKLERMAETVQVVYLGDDPTVANWALEAGFERAAVVTAPPPFA
jgi:hypothetical protein